MIRHLDSIARSVTHSEKYSLAIARAPDSASFRYPSTTRDQRLPFAGAPAAPACVQKNGARFASGPICFRNLVDAIDIIRPRHAGSAETLHLRDQLTPLRDRADAQIKRAVSLALCRVKRRTTAATKGDQNCFAAAPSLRVGFRRADKCKVFRQRYAPAKTAL